MADVCVFSFLLFILALSCAPPVQSYPDGGRGVCDTSHDTVCNKSLTLMSDSRIFVRLEFNDATQKDITVAVSVSRIDCHDKLSCPETFNCPFKGGGSHLFVTGHAEICFNTTEDVGNMWIKPSNQATEDNWNNATAVVGSIGVYHVSVNVTGRHGSENLRTISITLENPHGYLDAADYPAMVFYSIMLVVYVSLAVVWSVLLCCSYKDLIRLQFIIATVILLGVLEKTMFVAEYAVVNERGESFIYCAPSICPNKGYFAGYLVLAGEVSALKKTFVRVLLIIVSLGYGTVIRGLEGMLKWIVLFGVAFFATASLYELMVAFIQVTRDNLTPSVMAAFIPQVVMEVIFIFWIITAIIKTLRILRLHQSTKMLAYLLLLCAFVLAVIGIVAFCTWFYFGDLSDNCEDLQSLWLKDCFWHAIYTALLIVIMILWRPSANPVPSDYLPVQDEEEEEEMEQNVNKNLETMSKRQRTKGDEVSPPRPSNDMEKNMKFE